MKAEITLPVHRFSHTVDLIDVEEATRLHREALKQSATDPLSGKIDVSILTTGQSENKRKRRHLVKASLQSLIGKKGKVHTINYMKTWTELKEVSDVVRSSMHCYLIQWVTNLVLLFR